MESSIDLRAGGGCLLTRRWVGWMGGVDGRIVIGSKLSANGTSPTSLYSRRLAEQVARLDHQVVVVNLVSKKKQPPRCINFMFSFLAFPPPINNQVLHIRPNQSVHEHNKIVCNWDWCLYPADTYNSFTEEVYWSFTHSFTLKCISKYDQKEWYHMKVWLQFPVPNQKSNEKLIVTVTTIMIIITVITRLTIILVVIIITIMMRIKMIIRKSNS